MPNTPVPAAATGLPAFDRRALFAAVPALAAAAMPVMAVASSPPSVISGLIDAHRTAWTAYEVASRYASGLETVQRREPLTIAIAGEPHFVIMPHEDAALGTVRELFRAARLKCASDLAASSGSSAIRRALTSLQSEEAEANSSIRLAFEERRARFEASPAGLADRAATEASQAEDLAWDALLAAPCVADDDRLAKASYVLTSQRTLDLGLTAEEVHMLAVSFAGEADV